MTALLLVVASAAQEDLREIYRYGMRNWGQRKAGEYLKHFKECFWLLTTESGIGIVRPELGDGLRSFATKQHVVFYRLTESQVQIVRVLHGRQEAGRHLQ